LFEDDPAPAQVAAKKAKSPDEIERGVGDILGINLFEDDDAVKVDDLRTLTRYFASGDATNYADPQVEDYRRAIAECDGCHSVILVLEVELNKKHGASVHVVHAALSFVKCWNCRCAERHDTMWRVKGDEIVARAMQVFPNDPKIQLAGPCTTSHRTKTKNTLRSLSTRTRTALL
jgi:hypothetical protein